jgi:hypothetical protein
VHPLQVHSGTLALVGMPSYGTSGIHVSSQDNPPGNRCGLRRSTQRLRLTPQMVTSSRALVEAGRSAIDRAMALSWVWVTFERSVVVSRKVRRRVLLISLGPSALVEARRWGAS